MTPEKGLILVRKDICDSSVRKNCSYFLNNECEGKNDYCIIYSRRLKSQKPESIYKAVCEHGLET